MLGITYAKRSLKGATRGSESCNPPRRFCTRLLQQGSPFGPTFGGYNSTFPRSRLYSLAPARLALRVHLRWLQLDLPMVSFVLACSSKACFGSTYGDYNSTFPWSHFSGLVHLSFSPFQLSAFSFQVSGFVLSLLFHRIPYRPFLRIRSCPLLLQNGSLLSTNLENPEIMEWDMDPALTLGGKGSGHLTPETVLLPFQGSQRDLFQRAEKASMPCFHLGTQLRTIRFAKRNHPLIYLIEGKNPQLIAPVSRRIINRQMARIETPEGGSDSQRRTPLIEGLSVPTGDLEGLAGLPPLPRSGLHTAELEYSVRRSGNDRAGNIQWFRRGMHTLMGDQSNAQENENGCISLHQRTLSPLKDQFQPEFS